MDRLPELISSIALLIGAIAGLIEVLKPKRKKRK